MTDRAAIFDRVLRLEPGRTRPVLSTVVGAFNHEYRVSVVEDGVATLWPEIQRATLDIIGRAFGRVVSSKDVLDTISGWTQGAAR
jgi:isochorismate hydrolase